MSESLPGAGPPAAGAPDGPSLAVFRTVEAPADRLRRIRRLLDDAFRGEISDDDWAHALGGWHAILDESGELLAHGGVLVLRFGASANLDLTAPIACPARPGDDW